jgi:hypothetical protein
VDLSGLERRFDSYEMSVLSNVRYFLDKVS